MIKSEEALKILYFKLIYVISINHGLHKVAEVIREKY